MLDHLLTRMQCIVCTYSRTETDIVESQCIIKKLKEFIKCVVMKIVYSNFFIY